MNAESSTMGAARSLRSRKKHKSDITNGDNDHRDRGQNSESKTSKPVKRLRKGKLAALIDLPIDVLFEVFGHLKPFDLLKLSRTTKQLRNLLMHKSSKSVWKAVLSQISGLPPCPPEMSDPAWVNLVFDPQCNFCFTANTRAIEWEMRVRICNKCVPKYIEEVYISKTLPPENTHPFPLQTLMPSRAGKRGQRGILNNELEKLAGQYDALKDEIARVTFIREKRKALSDIQEHVHQCKLWAQGQTSGRSSELQHLRNDRCKAISRKLEDLGYAPDLAFASLNHWDSLENHDLVKKPQKLTERIWANIKDQLITYMDGIRIKRLDREFSQLVEERKLKAVAVFRAWKNNRLPHTDLVPPGLDFCDFPPVRGILEQPREVAVEESSFSELVPVIPDLVAAWRRSLDLKLIQLLKQEDKRARYYKNKPDFCPQYLSDYSTDDDIINNNSDADPPSDETTLPNKVKLAKTVYRCTTCTDARNPDNHSNGYSTDPDDMDLPSDIEDMDVEFVTNGLESDSDQDSYAEASVDTYLYHTGKKPCTLFYPKVLGHLCLMRKIRTDWFTPPKPTKKLDRKPWGSEKRRQMWSTRHLRVDEPLGRCAEGLITLAGLDPQMTTAEDMDAQDIWFACQSCSVATSNGGQRVMVIYKWRNAVEHYGSSHSRSNAEPVWMMFDPTAVQEGTKAYKASQQSLTENYCYAEPAAQRELKWLCVHCRDTPGEIEPASMDDLITHLEKKHEIKTPELNKDYYEDYAAIQAYTSPCQILYEMKEKKNKGKAKASNFR